MPFLNAEQAAAARARGEQVVTLPSSPPDGLVHYASTRTHFMCNPPSMTVNKVGSPHWPKVTCPECLRMGKRTERLNKDGTVKEVVKDMTKPRNQEEADVPQAPAE